jgi:CMP-N-acetylneuraminic acid synthetase
VYEENSNLYLFTEASLERRNNRIGDDPEMFPMDATEAIDIDEPVDFRVAEMLHRDRYGEEPSLDEVV